ncbi:hypothetical protein V1502_05530 [Bacillus sp. SCS-153A]
MRYEIREERFKVPLDKENRDVEKLEGWTITGKKVNDCNRKRKRL